MNINLFNYVSSYKRSKYTKFISNSKLKAVLEYYSYHHTLPDLSKEDVQTMDHAVLEAESNLLTTHILTDLIHHNYEYLDTSNLTLINDIKPNVDFNTLTPGIYTNLILEINYLEHSFKVNIPIVVVETNLTIHLMFIWTKTTFNIDLYLFNTKLLELLAFSSIATRIIDIDHHAVKYDLVKDVNHQIDYLKFNTFNLTDNVSVASNDFNYNDFSKLVHSSEFYDYEFTDNYDFYGVLNKIENANKTNEDLVINLDISYIKRTKDNKVRNYLKTWNIYSNQAYANLNRELKLGQLPLQTHFNQNENVCYNEKVKQVLNEKLKAIDFNLYLDAITTYHDLAILNTKMPEIDDYLYDDFDLMKKLYQARINENFAYSIYSYSSRIISGIASWWLFSALNEHHITNLQDVMNLFNHPSELFVTQDDKLYAKLQKDIDNYLNFHASTYSKVFDEKVIYYQFIDSIYNISGVPSSFSEAVRDYFSDQYLVFYDFETISTYLNLIPNQLGKSQLVTQCSMICTDNKLNIITNDPVMNKIDLVCDPKTFSIDDLLYLIDTIYNAMIKGAEINHGNCVGVVYNKGFEGSKLKNMISYLPQNHLESYTKKINYIVDNTVDLMDFFASHDFSLIITDLKGYYSIKYLEQFPNANKYPELDVALTNKYHLVKYETLDVDKGNWCLKINLERLYGLTSDRQWNVIRNELAKYCSNDVAMMIKQVANLQQLNQIVIDTKLFDKKKN